ncbi:Signal transduction histidine kinase, contains PAS domain [Halapricum desulfuricans]|uniref:histidine kinase n=1 Tax=Halapricum desulfuricans TaxID=2841257 RepID=A0A897NGV5_9EURY|nr:Signal transduction histidine kinase, contains PAS domain [Halapricum desulfuricans]
MNLITAGGVIGTLLGLIRELRTQYNRVDELNRRNTVLNQVMQHDIRNDVNVIEARTELLADQYDEINPEDIAPLQRKSEDIIEISQLTRHVQQLHEDSDTGPVNVVSLVSKCVSSMRNSYPDATISVSKPDEAWADTGELLQTVIKNLVENSIEHNDQSPDITIEVEVAGDDIIVIEIEDNGPGLPVEHREMLQADKTPETPPSGDLGLWLVKWFVDQYEGTLNITINEPRGTHITLKLPAATKYPAPPEHV